MHLLPLQHNILLLPSEIRTMPILTSEGFFCPSFFDMAYIYFFCLQKIINIINLKNAYEFIYYNSHLEVQYQC